jgi:hypothetical protein
MALQRTIQWLSLALVSFSLCACLGGSVAQQIARSIFTSGADAATASAMNAHERKEKLAAQQMPLKDTVPDKYQIAFLNSSFNEITAQIEPLPAMSLEDEEPVQWMQETKLVQVEVWSLLVGDEKQGVFEKARIQGSTSIPPKAEWQQWQIAVGASDNTTSNKKSNAQQQAITFLIPPEMGKIRSGTKAVVELSGTGELNVARYALN